MKQGGETRRGNKEGNKEGKQGGETGRVNKEREETRREGGTRRRVDKGGNKGGIKRKTKS